MVCSRLAFVSAANDCTLDKKLSNRIAKALREGFKPTCIAEAEGIMVFDPADPRLARLARKLLGIRLVPRRKLSKAFTEARRRTQFSRSAVVEGHSSA